VSSAHGPDAFASLRAPDYRRLWVTYAAASSGKWTLMLGLGWLVHTLTGSTFWVGVSVFAQMAPSLVVAPIAGVLADRFDRRRLLVLSLILSAAAAGMLAALSLWRGGNIGLVIAAAFVFGTASTLQSTWGSALLPNVVPRDALLNAIALQGTAERGSELVGPLLASPLLAGFGPGAVFLLCVLFYLWAIWATLRIRPLPPVVHQTEARRRDTSLRDGLDYVTSNPVLGTLLIMVLLHCGLTMSFMGLLPSLAQDALRSSSEGYGSLMAAIGLGAVVGSLALTGVKRHRVLGGLYLLTALLSGISLAALGFSPSLPVALGSAFAIGVSQTMFMTLSVAFIQDLVVDRFRGRVTSLYYFLAMGIMSLANWGYGALGTVMAPRMVITGAGLLFGLVTLLLVAAIPSLRRIMRGVAPEGYPVNQAKATVS
jgi:MFS family permease